MIEDDHLPMISHGMDDLPFFILTRTSYNTALHALSPPLGGCYPFRWFGLIRRNHNQHWLCRRTYNMQGTSVIGNAIKQTAWSSFMLRIVFQNLGCGNCLKNLVKRDVLFRHLLLRVLGNTDVLRRSLSTDSLQYRLQVDLVKCAHFAEVFSGQEHFGNLFDPRHPFGGVWQRDP